MEHPGAAQRVGAGSGAWHRAGVVGGCFTGTHPQQPGHWGWVHGHCHRLCRATGTVEPSPQPGDRAWGSPRVFLLRTGYSACVLGSPLVYWVVRLCTGFSLCVLGILLAYWVLLWHMGYCRHLPGIPLVYWVFLIYAGYSCCTLCTTSQCWHWEQLYSAWGWAAALLSGFLTFAVVGSGSSWHLQPCP